MQLSFMRILFGFFPESLLLIYVGISSNGIKTSLKNYFKISIFFVVGSIMTRNILELRVFVLCALLILLLKIFVEIDWEAAIISSLSGFIILLVGKVLFLSLSNNYLGINTSEIIRDDLLFFVAFYLIRLPLLFSAWLIYRFDFVVFDLESDEFESFSDENF